MFNQEINQRNFIEKSENDIKSNGAVRKSRGYTIRNRERS